MRDVPDSLDRHTVAVVVEPATWAVFECPCGHGHRLMVRLRPHDRMSHWSLAGDPPTLHPSIDSTIGGRRCHFWLQGGRVRWV
jgi:hypothetical protein